MRLVFAGTPAVALPALDAIAASSHDLVAVVSRPDAPSGRGRQLVPSPVSAWALERGIEVLTPTRPRDPSFLERLAALEPDCCPVVAYGALVPRVAVEHVDEAGLTGQLRPHDLDRDQALVTCRRARAIDLGHSAACDEAEKVILPERHRIIRCARG